MLHRARSQSAWRCFRGRKGVAGRRRAVVHDPVVRLPHGSPRVPRLRWLGMTQTAARFQRWRDLSAMHFHYLSREEWVRLLEACGFTDVRIHRSSAGASSCLRSHERVGLLSAALLLSTFGAMDDARTPTIDDDPGRVLHYRLGRKGAVAPDQATHWAVFARRDGHRPSRS